MKITDKENIKTFLNYSWNQVCKLKNQITETAKHLGSNLGKNTESLKKLFGYNVENFKILFNENWNIISGMLEVNEELIGNYFKKLDVEIYHGNGDVSKPVEYLRELYYDLMNDENYKS